MPQRLHLVFGGEFVDPSGIRLWDAYGIDIVDMFPDCACARAARKAAAQRSADDAHTRHSIAHIHRLRDVGQPPSPAAELGD